jgi:hypothetical protein
MEVSRWSFSRAAAVLLARTVATALPVFGARYGAQLIENAVKVDEIATSRQRLGRRCGFRGIYGKRPGIVWRSVASTRVKRFIAAFDRGRAGKGIAHETGGEVFSA